jgi:5-methylcytosine-specific restriction protein A
MVESAVGADYTRADIYELLDVPEEKQGGAWNRGYREWVGEMFIFATVGVGMTSGFD